MWLKFYTLIFALIFSCDVFSNDLYKKAEKEVTIAPSKIKTNKKSHSKSPAGLLQAQMKKEDIMPTYDELKVGIVSSQSTYKVISKDFIFSRIDNPLGISTHIYKFKHTFNNKVKLKVGGALSLLAGQSKMKHKTLPTGSMRSFFVQPTITMEFNHLNWSRLSLLTDIGYSYHLVAYSSPYKFNNFSEEIQSVILSSGLRFHFTKRLSILVKQTLPLNRLLNTKIALESGHTMVGIEGGIH